MSKSAARNPTPATRESGKQEPARPVRQAAKQTQMPEPFDYSELFAMASANMNAFMSTTEVWLRGLSMINEELVQFADARMHAVNEAARGIAEADGVDRVTDVSFDYARNAAGEYFAETAKLVNLTADLARDSWMPVQQAWRNGFTTKAGRS